MKKSAVMMVAILFFGWLTVWPAYGVEIAERISDREIVERLTRLEVGVKALEQGQRAILREMDKRFEAMDKRFEAMTETMNRRFEAMTATMDKRSEATVKNMDERFKGMDNRFETMDARFGQMIDIMVGIILAFAGIVAVTIIFALWDRRTMIRPFENKIKQVEEDIAHNRAKLGKFLEVLRSLARTNDKLAEALRSFSLM